MSSLSVALAILGGLVLAAVIGYNAWMSHRNAPRQPDAGDMRDIGDGDDAPPSAAVDDDDGDDDSGAARGEQREPVLHIDAAGAGSAGSNKGSCR